MSGLASGERLPAGLIVALSVTQIVGYGTQFYFYAILSPSIEASFGWSSQFSFAVFSAGLLLSGLAAPKAGRLADRLGAGAVMTCGSLVCAAGLAIAALSPSGPVFAAALVATLAASALVQYSVAFVAIVQLCGPAAARGIVYVTLIAGFASTLFWPLTQWLLGVADWRTIMLIYAGLNLAMCVPLHGWIGRLHRKAAKSAPPVHAATETAPLHDRPPARRRLLFWLMMIAIGCQSVALTAILVHMAPLTAALGMGAAGIWASTLFGPSQVASRLINLLFGQRLRQAWLATISAVCMLAGILVVVTTSPWLPGALIFMALFGFGSGIYSIVGGTLPLELFGRASYGATVGWASSARQFAGAFSPFALAAMMAAFGVDAALLTLAGVAAVAAAVYACIAITSGPK